MPNVSCVSLPLTQEEIEKVRYIYSDEATNPSSPYVEFEAKAEGCRVFVYSKRDQQGRKKVVFQGEKAEEEAEIFGYQRPSRDLPKPSPYPQIGSDEVGTGDFFGPVIVVAAYVKKGDLPLLARLGVTDSKKLTDEKIREIAPKLIQSLDYSSLTLGNEKYNEIRDEGTNLNKMKAILHNAALLNLKKKHPYGQACIDQFAEPKLYFSYLRQEKEVLRDIAFSVKGELAFPSVAAASVIARFSFLKRMEELGEQYGVDFPFGAGKEVDQFAQYFVEKFGIEELRKVAKTNFVNYRRLSE